MCTNCLMQVHWREAQFEKKKDLTALQTNHLLFLMSCYYVSEISYLVWMWCFRRVCGVSEKSSFSRNKRCAAWSLCKSALLDVILAWLWCWMKCQGNTKISRIQPKANKNINSNFPGNLAVGSPGTLLWTKVWLTRKYLCNGFQGRQRLMKTWANLLFWTRYWNKRKTNIATCVFIIVNTSTGCVATKQKLKWLQTLSQRESKWIKEN